MKKVLCLMCVLAMCATASARLFVGGDEDAGDFNALPEDGQNGSITTDAAIWEQQGNPPDSDLWNRNNPNRTVDGSGLDETGQMHNAQPYTTIPGVHFLTENDDRGNPNGELDLGGSWIRWDFDTVYTLGEFRVWNHNDFTDRGWRTVGIAYQNADDSWTRLGGDELFEIPAATRSSDYEGAILTDFAGVDAKSVIMAAVSKPEGGNHGGGNGGLSEVRFYLGGPGPSCDPGDADGDGDVDDDDLSLLLANWGAEGATCLQGEFSGTSPIDDDDLSLLLANWTGPMAAAVPEPATMSLIALGSLALIRRKR